MKDSKSQKDFFVKITTIQMLMLTLVFVLCLVTIKKSEDKGIVFLSEYKKITAQDMSLEDIKSLIKKDESEPHNEKVTEEQKDTDKKNDEKSTEAVFNNNGNKEETSAASGNNAQAVISISKITDKRNVSVDFLSSQLESEPVFPVKGSITSAFGGRVSPIYNYNENHKGVDIAARTGSTVRAVKSGVVSNVDYTEGRGNFVIIDHGTENGNKIQTLYQHCKKILVEEGTVVRAGEAIALVGSTGDSTGPHLHLEYRINGECVDPIEALFGEANAI